MTTRADHRLTVDEYRLLPEGPPHYQLVDGELFMTPAPSFRHNDVAGAIYAAVRSHVSASRSGKAAMGPVDVFLDATEVFQPDVLFVAQEHLGRIREDGVHGAPDLVVEVLSPSTRRLDLAVKRVRYAAAGVVEAWYVDLDMDEVIVYRLQEDAAVPARTLRRGETLGSALLPGFAIGVDALVDAT